MVRAGSCTAMRSSFYDTEEGGKNSYLFAEVKVVAVKHAREKIHEIAFQMDGYKYQTRTQPQHL